MMLCSKQEFDDKLNDKQQLTDEAEGLICRVVICGIYDVMIGFTR